MVFWAKTQVLYPPLPTNRAAKWFVQAVYFGPRSQSMHLFLQFKKGGEKIEKIGKKTSLNHTKG